MAEEAVESGLISKLKDLKYEYREDIRDRASLEKNFRRHFEKLNRGTTRHDQQPGFRAE